MKITLDLPSVAAGGAIALVLGLVAGFSPQATQVAPQRPANAVPLNGALRPAARDSFFMQGGDSPFTVPAGRVLVIQTRSNDGTGSRGEIRVDGAFLSPFGFWGQVPQSTRVEFHSGGIGGVLVGEGATVDLARLDTGAPAAVSEWIAGYLEDA